MELLSRRRRFLPQVSLALALFCGACGQESDTGPDASLATVATLATTVSTPSGGPVTGPPASTDSEFTLRSDGLGVIYFGEPADTTAAVLIDRFGPPSSEWEFTPPGPADGGCGLATGYGCKEYFRSLSWEEIGLSVVLIDVSQYRDDGAPHFAAWAVGGSAGAVHLVTDAGIGVGASVDDLRAAYPNQLQISPWLDVCESEESWEFRTDGAVMGSLSGPPDASTTIVSSLSAGIRSSC
jgi:hypothetical protein